MAAYYVNTNWWNKLDPQVRAFLEQTMKEVERAQWELGAKATEDGIACNTGNKDGCKIGKLVEQNPMTVTRPTKADEETLLVTGDLKIKDVTRPVTVEFTLNGSAKDIYGNTRVGFEGATTISRKDWGLSYNAALETGGVLISDKIKLDFDVSAIATPAA